MTPEQEIHKAMLELIATSMIQEECDRYIVLTVDPMDGDKHSYGPLTAMEAMVKAEVERKGLNQSGLGEIEIHIVPCSEPT